MGRRKVNIASRGGAEEYYANLELLRTFVDDALLFLACCIIGCWLVVQLDIKIAILWIKVGITIILQSREVNAE